MASASKNIFWLSLSRVIALAILFFAYTQLFRYLGPYNSGQYQFVLSFVTIFGIVVDFGIQQYIIKKISEQPDKAKTYFHNFLAVEVVLVLVIYGAIILTASLGSYEKTVYWAMLVAGLGTSLNGLTYPFLAVMSAFQDLKKVAALNFLNSLINATVIFAVIFGQGTIVWLATNQVIFALLGLVIYYQIIKKYIPQPQVMQALFSLDLNLVKKIFIAALPFALLVGFSTVYNRIDVLLITKILGYGNTGLYTAAYKFFDLISFFPAVVSHSLYPVFASLMAQGAKDELRLRFQRYLKIMWALAIPVGIGGSLLAKPIIIILAGKEYVEAAPVLAILVWAPAALFVYITANSLVISQLTKFAVVITGVNVAINLIGNLLLLPRIGIRGAAIMTVASEFLQGLFYLWFVRKKIMDFYFFRYIIRPFVASIIMGTILYWSGLTVGYSEFSSEIALIQRVLLTAAVGGVIYALSLLAMGFLDSDDYKLLDKLIVRLRLKTNSNNGQ